MLGFGPISSAAISATNSNITPGGQTLKLAILEYIDDQPLTLLNSIDNTVVIAANMSGTLTILDYMSEAPIASSGEINDDPVTLSENF